MMMQHLIRLLIIPISLLLFFFVFLTSCAGQDKAKISNHTNSVSNTQSFKPDSSAQIAEYVVEVFEDSKGNLWFGTIPNGLARYDGESLTYFTTEDGLAGNNVGSIIEDKAGDIWIATHGGLSRFDGKTFMNFTTEDGLIHNRVSNLLIDKFGTLWVGTWGGISLFNGVFFSDFELPIPDVKLLPYQSTMDWITEIMEDEQGNIWIGRDGYGACKYDGNSFTLFTKKDGLASNNIQGILEDEQGNIWFTSRVAETDNPDANQRTGDGGLSKYDGEKIIQFPEVEGLGQNGIYSLYEDKSDKLWIGANGLGLYHYDGQKFTLYSETDRKDLMPYGFGIQSILEDRNGTIWLGLSGGLFRLEDSIIVNVTQAGPWK